MYTPTYPVNKVDTFARHLRCHGGHRKDDVGTSGNTHGNLLCISAPKQFVRTTE
jgi:hypothetical protein